MRKQAAYALRGQRLTTMLLLVNLLYQSQEAAARRHMRRSCDGIRTAAIRLSMMIK